MSKTYRTTTDEMREHLIRLIHEEGYSIRQASFKADIFYPTAKVINKIYMSENRIEKKKKRNRKKKSLGSHTIKSAGIPTSSNGPNTTDNQFKFSNINSNPPVCSNGQDVLQMKPNV